jgi:hypothetical protein
MPSLRGLSSDWPEGGWKPPPIFVLVQKFDVAEMILDRFAQKPQHGHAFFMCGAMDSFYLLWLQFAFK